MHNYIIIHIIHVWNEFMDIICIFITPRRQLQNNFTTSDTEKEKKSYADFKKKKVENIEKVSDHAIVAAAF